MKRAVVVRAALLIGSLALSLAAIETGLRLASPLDPFGSRLALRPRVDMRLEVDLRGVSRQGRHSTNAWGLRGDEPPPPDAGDYRIIAIGGSTTQGFYLDDRKTWPYRLQERLKEAGWEAWVGNAGLDGQSTRGHIIFMEDVVARVRPDAVIVLAGINDLWYSLDERRRLHGSRYDRPDWLTVLYRRSRLAQVLYAWGQLLLGEALLVRRSGHGNFEPRPLSRDAAAAPEDVRLLLPGLPEYRQNLERIVALARSMGVRPILMTQPLLFEDSEYWQTIEGGFYWIEARKAPLAATTYWRMLDAYNREMLDVCARQRVECLDLARQVPARPDYFYDAAHFTEAGAELVARSVAGFLLDRRPPSTIR
ncbi:MAG: hypothetical protein A2X36_02140 [Elusimicrobia bacterium GWA2_69_24]|nr:MAG: hypothetical protein A2W08_16880 [Candidatus Rokubacteria bacterium RBG_16_73_20]OGR60850.1 MAG: hypothetical protein A2X36_02140 [Elusimicrobia bacterium GWA2_69_24]HBH00816.1 hypothetical protein [Candidatus Rokubacteria bacterium]